MGLGKAVRLGETASSASQAMLLVPTFRRSREHLSSCSVCGAELPPMKPVKEQPLAVTQAGKTGKPTCISGLHSIPS